jgi:DNA mismatch repair ATPase MutS
MRERIIILIVQEILSHKEFLEKIEEVIGEIDYYIGLSLAITQLRLCIPKLNN